MDTWKQWLVLWFFFEKILDPGIEQCLVDQPLSNVPGVDDPAFQVFLEMAGAAQVTTTGKLFEQLSIFRAEHLCKGMHAHGEVSAPLYAIKDGATGWVVMDQVFDRLFDASLSLIHQKYYESAAMQNSTRDDAQCWIFGLETADQERDRDSYLAVASCGADACRLMDARLPRLAREGINKHFLRLRRNGETVCILPLIESKDKNRKALPDISNSLYVTGSHFSPDWSSIIWSDKGRQYADNSLLVALGRMDEGRGKHLVRGEFLEESLGI